MGRDDLDLLFFFLPYAIGGRWSNLKKKTKLMVLPLMQSKMLLSLGCAVMVESLKKRFSSGFG